MDKTDYKPAFMRTLKTNYKYSCLVTLTMNLTKKYDLYNFSQRYAKRNGIKLQKNYSIILLRIGLLLKKT